MFVSWEGWYQNCGDKDRADNNLLWTIAVSKISKDPRCIKTDGLNPVSFGDCTTPVSIFYQANEADSSHTIGYSGFAVSRSPSQKRVFYMSVLHITDFNGYPSNEIWVMPEGGNHAKNQDDLQSIASVKVNPKFEFLEDIYDIGTIRLQLDDDGLPKALCRTAYDAGIFCHSLSIEHDGKVSVKGDTTTFVTAEQVAESCTIPASEHFPITQYMPPMSTGLEVAWNNERTDGVPDKVYFGCYGEIPGHGNLATAFRDGNVVQTLEGAFAGSILFGTDLPELPVTSPQQEIPGVDRSPQLLSFLLLVAFSVGLISLKKSLQKRQVRYDRLDVYNGLMPEPTSSTSVGLINPSDHYTYMEMPSRV
jgi:hypothetical protein